MSISLEKYSEENLLKIFELSTAFRTSILILVKVLEEGLEVVKQFIVNVVRRVTQQR